MKDYSNLINKTYYKITVIEKDYDMSIKKNRQYYVCRCECGNIKSIRADDLESNKVKSCGCYNSSTMKNITNQRFNNLIAIEYKYTNNKKAYWLCECDCGNFIIVSQSNLHSNHTKSCGCIRRGDNTNNTNNTKKHFRNILKRVISDKLKESKYTCFISNKKTNLQVHHIISFDYLYKKSISELGLTIYDDFNMYTKTQKEEIDKIFLSYHKKDILMVLNENVHVKFHQLYGYKNNNSEQIKEFIGKYKI